MDAYKTRPHNKRKQTNILICIVFLIPFLSTQFSTLIGCHVHPFLYKIRSIDLGSGLISTNSYKKRRYKKAVKIPNEMILVYREIHWCMYITFDLCGLESSSSGLFPSCCFSARRADSLRRHPHFLMKQGPNLNWIQLPPRKIRYLENLLFPHTLRPCETPKYYGRAFCFRQTIDFGD